MNYIIAYAKEYGLLGLLKAGIKKYFFRHEHRFITCRLVEDPIPEIQPPHNIIIRKATLADLNEISQLIYGDKRPHYKKEIPDWIAKGYPIYVALDGERIVGYGCVVLEPPLNRSILDEAVHFQENDAWGADAFVHPAYRGKNIYPALMAEQNKCLITAGYKRIIGEVVSNNLSSRSSLNKIGAKIIKEMTYTNFLFFRMLRVKSLEKRRNKQEYK